VYLALHADITVMVKTSVSYYLFVIFFRMI
jgi:hypothetical protein